MRRKTKQGLWAVLLAAAVACLVPTVTAYAIEGWNREGDEWQYLNREDQPVTNAFKKSARLQDQVGQSEIIPPANCNEKIFGGVD